MQTSDVVLGEVNDTDVKEKYVLAILSFGVNTGCGGGDGCLGVNSSSRTEFNKLFLKIPREESVFVRMSRANPTGTSHSLTTCA